MQKKRQAKSWKGLLQKKLTKKQLSLLPSSFDIVGSVLIFNDFPEGLTKKEKLIGEAILAVHKNILTVCKKAKKYSGKFRLPKLKIIAGERRKETIHRESGVQIKLNPENTYFSTRLSNERLRIAKQITGGEDVLVMFSGCGPYPLVISKNSKAKIICGVEMNPKAHSYALENLRINKLKNLLFLDGDVKDVVPKMGKKFDRILMPLPMGAEDFLGVALSAVKPGGMIHFYDFLKEGEFSKAEEKIKGACKIADIRYNIIDIVKCGKFGPSIFRICVDFKVS